MSDTEDERIFEVEIANNGRAGCKKCKQKCLQGELRIAKITANPFGDGKMKNWHHLDCLFGMFEKQRATTKRIECEEDIIGFDSLSTDNQKYIKRKIEHIRLHFGGSDKTNKSPSKKNKQTNIEAAKPSFKKDQSGSVDTEDNLLKTFQGIVQQVANHSSYLDKTGIIKTFFLKGTNGVKFEGDIEIWCKLLLPGSVKRIYNLQSKQLVKLFSRILLENLDGMFEHLERGDVSDTISFFYKQSLIFAKSIPKKSTITIQQVDSFLEYLSKLSKEEDQIDHFTRILKILTTDDLKTIIRLIKHDLRMGAGAKHILDGIHPNAYEVFKASKDLDGVIERCFGNNTLQKAEIKVMTPVFPMLAEACKSVDYAMKKCPNGMFSEIKYDGERVQVHKHGNEFKYFSRSLKPVMPHKVAHFKDYIPKAFPHATDLILDCEILMMDTNTGKPLPFGTLGVHKKAQFQDASVCLFVFDCIYYNEESLMQRPLMERRQILMKNMIEVPNHVVFSEMQNIDEPNKLAQMIAKVLKLGLEGLVLKDRMSKYEPGKRHWLKVKKDYLFDGAMADSADLIVLGAWYGTGQKGGMMSVFLMGCYNKRTKRFCTVTKVHTGHDDKTLEKLQHELKMEKISGDPDKLPKWLNCTRTMVPDFVAIDPEKQPVWEITGAEFTQQHDVHTADGISIRFPRVTKIRQDKSWETATSVEELCILYKKSKEDTDVNLLLKNYREQLDDHESDSLKSEEWNNKKPVDESSSSCSTKSNHSPKKRKISDESITRSKKMTKQKSSNKQVNKIKTVRIEKPLPTIFKGIKAAFIESDMDFERYFIACGGSMLRKMNRLQPVTHIFHPDKKVRDTNTSWPKSAKHLHFSWISNSVNDMKLATYQPFLVTFEPVGDMDLEQYEKVLKHVHV